MKPLYRNLLVIGIAMGVVATSLIIGIGQTLLIQMDRSSEITPGNYWLYQSGGKNIIEGMSLTLAREIQKWLPENALSSVIAVDYGLQSIEINEEFYTPTILGVDANFPDLFQSELISGRFFSETDQKERSKVCVVTSDIYELFGESLTTIKVDDNIFEVIGVIQGEILTAGNFVSDYSTNSVFFPVEVFYEDVLKADHLSGFVMRIPISAPEYTKSQIQAVISQKLAVKDDAPVLKVVASGESENSELAEVFLVLAGIFLIAFVVLLLAGLNIVQIASASVYDRQRVLGLKVALGASPKDILKEVSGEVTLSSLQGGYLGIVLAGIINTLINRYVGEYWAAFNILTALAGVILAFVVGWITSLIPARRAISIDPVKALREER